MPPKQQLDKAAWKWAETTEPDDVTKENVCTAYRVTMPSCKKGSCRRNCKGNPHCLIGLGERGWMAEIEDESWHDIEDPNNERRTKGSFVGLKNLGATCYVNTFIQVWFHNPEFRNGIYKWRDLREILVDSTHSEEKLVDEIEYTPTSACGHLQQIFSLLQFSQRRYIDISHFTTFLGLNTLQQQDAQEFSKLLMSLLEDNLSQQPDITVQNLIQNQFSGQYDYVTRCNKCERSSQRPSEFYELDLNIKGHKELQECIEEFLEEEKLEDDNKYMCAQCSCKQNATRHIELRSLPPVLNMQLLRFVFDRKTGHKKKLNTYIQFPEVLDMSKYLRKQDGEVLYDLVAVLIHRGPSAYSGHYVAHIKDRTSETWYKFNDEDIEKMAGKNLQLGNEEEIDGKGAKRPRTTKGHHSSRNAYMLVYKKQVKHLEDSKSCGEKPVEEDVASLPEKLQQFILQDNQQFEDWVKEMVDMRDKNVATGKARQQEVIELYNMLQVPTGAAYEWVPTEWLTKWLAESSAEKVPVIDNGPMLCQHGKLHPDSVVKMKCISQGAAEIIYSKYNGGPRLDSECLCHSCIVNRCRVIRTGVRVNEDSKVIGEVLKVKNLDIAREDGYWIGKRSLRSWKRFVLEQLEDGSAQNGTSASLAQESTLSSSANESVTHDTTLSSSTIGCSEGEIAGSSNILEQPVLDTDEIPKSTEQCLKSTGESMDQDDDREQLIFNEDLLCETHGNLSTDTGCRRLIPSQIWERLKSYFPSAPEFPGDAEPCARCLALEEADEALRNAQKISAVQQKNALLDLYHDRHRPDWSKNINQLNVITRDFVEDWRKWIRDPTKVDLVKEIGNRSLLCLHNGFPFDPATLSFSESAVSLIYIHIEEWAHLNKFYPGDVEILVSRVAEEDGNVTFLASPDVCMECCEARRLEEQRALLNYKDAKIYVRRMDNDNKPLPGFGCDVNGARDSGDDPEFIQQNGKRKKSDAGVGKKEEGSPAEKLVKLDPIIRRSSRHRRMRGEKEIVVSSNTNLLDLRVKIMHAVEVAPFDQHLILNGQELPRDNKVTMAELRIIPGSVLYLKVDEPNEDPTFLEDISKASCPEEGFKGTGLQGR